ncbi:MAG: hypothetical protein MJY95_08415 [Bacteroidaceae bacterium]|nr:hypothetical protein [Bacteroidaceae bacterium]
MKAQALSIMYGGGTSLAKFKVDFSDWTRNIEMQFKDSAKEVIPVMKVALYDGAGYVADNLRSAVVGHGDLANGLALTEMKSQNADTVSINCLFTGYNDEGVPYALIANVLETGRGTDKVGKHPFFQKTIKATRNKAVDIMNRKFYGIMNKKLKGED